jgi:hypothetical protein
MRATIIIAIALGLSGCKADRDRQFAQCERKYGKLGVDQQPGKVALVALCMKAAGYREVYPCSIMNYTARECWE